MEILENATNDGAFEVPTDNEWWETLLALWGPVESPTEYGQTIYRLCALMGVVTQGEQSEKNIVHRVNRGDAKITLISPTKLDQVYLINRRGNGLYTLDTQTVTPLSQALEVLNKSIPLGLKQLLYYGE